MSGTVYPLTPSVNTNGVDQGMPGTPTPVRPLQVRAMWLASLGVADESAPDGLYANRPSCATRCAPWFRRSLRAPVRRRHRVKARRGWLPS